MLRLLPSLALLLSLMSPTLSHAAMVILDFEQFAPQTVGVSFFNLPAFSESGFDVVEVGGDNKFAVLGDLHSSYIGDVAMINQANTKLQITETDASNFDVLSINVARLLVNVTSDITFEVGGIDTFGNPFSQMVTTDAPLSQNIALNFNDIASFYILAGNDIEDRVQLSSVSINSEATVSAVPIPAAAWLFATGLVGLAGIRRMR